MIRPKFPDFCKKLIAQFVTFTILGSVAQWGKSFAVPIRNPSHLLNMCSDLSRFNETITIVYAMWGIKLNNLSFFAIDESECEKSLEGKTD